MLFGFPDVAELVSRIIVLIVAFTLHEFAHAAAATYFGDETPRLYGRLTLNPLAHLDPMGSIMLLLVGFGWAKPVPINPYALQRRSSAATMWVSLAGPLANFALAVLFAIPFRLGLLSVYEAFPGGRQIVPTLAQLALNFVYIDLVLMLFNLIPLAPLDGEKVAQYIFPPSWGRVLDTLRPYGPLILLVVFIVLPYFNLDIVNWIIAPPLNALVKLLVG